MAGSYRAYRASSRWYQLRREAIVRDGFRCRLCNGRRHLEVHHRTYPAFMGEETVTDLTTLCSRCHDRVSEFLGHKRSGGTVTLLVLLAALVVWLWCLTLKVT